MISFGCEEAVAFYDGTVGGVDVVVLGYLTADFSPLTSLLLFIYLLTTEK